jgi:thiol-disulfide isomerase/thioredoxin
MRRRQFLLSSLLVAAAPASAQGYLKRWPAPAVPADPDRLKPWDGVVTPPLELDDLEGKPHRLADYRGKVVLINFWATWCKPCRDEMPSIERLRVALEKRPFAVLAVNVGEGPGAARTFAASLPLGFPLLLDRDTRASRAWGARILPATFVVDAGGVARLSYFGELDWAKPEVREQVEKLLPQ